MYKCLHTTLYCVNPIHTYTHMYMYTYIYIYIYIAIRTTRSLSWSREISERRQVYMVHMYTYIHMYMYT